MRPSTSIFRGAPKERHTWWTRWVLLDTKYHKITTCLISKPPMVPLFLCDYLLQNWICSKKHNNLRGGNESQTVRTDGILAVTSLPMVVFTLSLGSLRKKTIYFSGSPTIPHPQRCFMNYMIVFHDFHDVFMFFVMNFMFFFMNFMVVFHDF